MALSKKQQQNLATGQNLSGQTMLENLAFNSQCFLTQHMEWLAHRVKKCYEPLRGSSFTAPVNDNSTFQYLVPVLGDNGNIRGPETFTRLVKKGNAAHLMALSPRQMALLTPRIDLYKVVYEEKKDPLEADQDNPRYIPDLDKPTTDIPILFDHQLPDIQDLSEIYDDAKGRLPLNGIKSFSWSLRGVNPAEADANIEATLRIYFNNVGSVTGLARSRGKQGAAVLQKTGQPVGASTTYKASFLDLITWSPSEDIDNNTGVVTGTVSSDNDARRNPSARRYDGRFFELKAVVGWSLPPKSTGVLSSNEREAIDNTTLSLYLQLTGHDFAFNQDGSAILTIKYQARNIQKRQGVDVLDAIDASRERERAVLQKSAPAPGSPEATRIEELDKEIDSAKKERYSKFVKNLFDKGHMYQAWARPAQLRIVRAGANSNDIVGANPAEVAGPTGLLSTAYDADPAADVSQYNPAGAASIMPPGSSQFLFKEMGKATDQAGREENSLSGLTLREEFFQHPVGVTRMLLTGRNSSARPGHPSTGDDIDAYIEGIIDDDEQFEETEISDLSAYDTQPRAWTAQTDCEYGDMTDPNAGTWVPGGTQRARGNLQNQAIPVAFTTFGDLINNVIDDTPELKREVEKGRLGFLFTDFEYLNPEVFYSTAEALVATGGRFSGLPRSVFFDKLASGQYSFTLNERNAMLKTINLASVPISFDNFLQWFLDNVVTPRREKYYFEDFIGDIITGLIAPGLSADCFWGMPNTKKNVSYVPMMADYDSQFVRKTYGEILGMTPTTVPRTKAVLMGNAVAQPGLLFDSQGQIPDTPYTITPATTTVQTSTGVNKHMEFKVVMLTSHDLSYRKGDRSKDMEAGIWHFIVGEDVGLLKQASFRRMDQPYLRESRINRDRTMGAEQLRELYTVTVTLYGTTIFKPGMYIYLTPSVIGFGDPRNFGSLSRTLGIGGYHLVTGVESTIAVGGGFQTVLTALHEAQPMLADD